MERTLTVAAGPLDRSALPGSRDRAGSLEPTAHVGLEEIDSGRGSGPGRSGRGRLAVGRAAARAGPSLPARRGRAAERSKASA